jgi:hypothetical protein
MDDDMPTRVRLLRIAGLALSLALTTGCAEDARPPVRNHAPKQAYLITLTVENPPAPVTAIEGHASYQVMDTECLPKAFYFGYNTGISAVSEPVRLRPVAPNVWQGVVHPDLYLDQPQTDDLGVCDWEFIGAGAEFLVKGFRLAVDVPKSSLGTTIRYRFKNEWLTNPAFADFRQSGDRVDVGSTSPHAGQYFYMDVDAKEVTHGEQP